MFDCLNLPMTPWNKLWRRALFHLCLKLGSWPLLYPAIEIELLASPSLNSADVEEDGHCEEKNSSKMCEDGPTKRAIVVMQSKHHKKHKDAAEKFAVKLEAAGDESLSRIRHVSNGGCSEFSLFTKQGLKGINQDAMAVWEKFASEEDTVFCGVFDGHGHHGHRVSRNVRDMLPQMLACSWRAQRLVSDGSSFSSEDSEMEAVGGGEGDPFGDSLGDPSLIMAWKESFVMAYKLMDRELLMNDHVDCVTSGTTAVTLVKQGNDLIVGNVGDSRAVLGTRASDDSLLALQLTIDLKPNIPREANRIKRRKGRVFALQNEPSTHRVWLPYHNAPGLAMARSLGDYCVKNYGVISEPEITYRRLTKRDEFVVLATDGVWDALTNDQVVEIVASAPDKSLAARRVVECAVHTWKSKCRSSKVDDCAAICLFL